MNRKALNAQVKFNVARACAESTQNALRAATHAFFADPSSANARILAKARAAAGRAADHEDEAFNELLEATDAGRA